MAETDQGDSGSLPKSIVDAIAISNAKSIGEQPAILTNMALANQVLNNNMSQQIMISQQQAFNQIAMATMSKCIAIITKENGITTGEALAVDELVKILKNLLPDDGKGEGGNGGD